jgi:2-polyprenyl-6-methoxyphenol hydroxylase-like FAD-dependent oxidoreductase
MNPTGAAGALTAMHDAVTLANWICTLDAPSPSEIDYVFKEYRAERYPVAKESFEASQLFTKTLGKVRRHTQKILFLLRINETFDLVRVLNDVFGC